MLKNFDSNNFISSALNVKYHLYLNDSVGKKDLNILYLNAQSIRNKLYDIEIMINNLKCETDIIVVTEIWIREEENPFFKNYNAYFCNKHAGYEGTAIFVRHHISSAKIFCNDNDFCQILVVKLIENDINVISVYRSQKNNIKHFFSTFESILTNYKRSYVVGDFNINMLDEEDNDVSTYRELINSFGYTIVNKIAREYATRVRNGIGTIIDHTVTDLLRYSYDLSIADTHLSDHRLLYLRVSNLSFSKPPTTQTMTVLQYENIFNDSGWVKVRKAFTVSDLTDGLSGIVKRNTKIIEKNVRHKQDMEWMTPEISMLMEERDRFFRYKKQDPENSYITERHSRLSKVVASKIKFAKKKLNSKYIKQYVEKPKQLWMYLKKIIFNNSSSKISSVYIQYQNTLIKDPMEIANCFNTYFCNITMNITNHLLPPTDIDFEYLSYTINKSFELNPVTISEIRIIIGNLNQNAATGLDGLSIKFLKYSLDYIEDILVDLINKSFTEGVFPEVLKLAKIIPIYKNGNALDINNYRPIAILVALSKIFEKAIADRLERFLQDNNIISARQFGFSQKSNTLAATMSLTNYLSEKFDGRKFCGCIFLDIRRAFDSVHHSIFMIKLKKLGLTINQLKLFESYLMARKQVVTIDGTNSFEQTMNKGVPQGSILGPSLFRLYINDICFEHLLGTLQLYADDGVIMYAAETVENLLFQMQHDMDILKRWFDKNHLILNHDKTKLMLFENRILDAGTLNSFSVTYDSFVIERVAKFNYLGLTIDNKLNWTEHINGIKKSITPYIFAINRTKELLPKETLMLMYNAYIQSRLVYLNAIWSGCAKYKFNELWILQKRVLKCIIRVPSRYPTALLCQQFDLLNILSERELLVLIYKIVNNIIKHNFIITTIQETHDYSTRRCSHFKLKFFSTNARNNNILYRGLSKFNELPADIKQSNSPNIFKQKLMKYLRSSD